MGRAGRRVIHIVAACSVVFALLAAPSFADAIDFLPSLPAARAQNPDRKPVVITFSASWCGWCRKMSATTFTDPGVAEIASDFVWVKLDADEEPELAARYRVRGLPHVVLLDADERLLGSHPGYLSPEALIAFLQQSLASPQPATTSAADLLARWQTANETNREVVLSDALEFLARAPQNERAALIAMLKQAGPSVYPSLVTRLEDDRLAVRAAAAGALRQLAVDAPPFDPFTDRATRTTQALAWKKWIGQESHTPPVPAAADSPEPAPEPSR